MKGEREGGRRRDRQMGEWIVGRKGVGMDGWMCGEWVDTCTHQLMWDPALYEKCLCEAPLKGGVWQPVL